MIYLCFKKIVVIVIGLVDLWITKEKQKRAAYPHVGNVLIGVRSLCTMCTMVLDSRYEVRN